ncbi:MAG: helix-turn-helix domain-containing protein [Myxococcota bacterium]
MKAAQTLLSDRGVDRVSMTDIATASDMSKAAVYRYFPSKQSVIRELAIREMEADRRTLEALLNPDAPDRETAAVRADVELARLDHEDSVRAAQFVAEYLKPGAPAEVRVAYELRVLLVLGLLDGLLQLASHVDANAVSVLVDGFVHMAQGALRDIGPPPAG